MFHGEGFKRKRIKETVSTTKDVNFKYHLPLEDSCAPVDEIKAEKKIDPSSEKNIEISSSAHINCLNIRKLTT